MNQFDTPKIKIGTKIKDFKIIGITKKPNETRDYYVLECQKCHRTRLLPRKVVLNKKYQGLNHDIGCAYLIPKSKYKSRLNRIWSGMYARTHLKSQKSYKDYSNIKIKYNSFIDFYDDQIKPYTEHVKIYGEKDTTIDRINVFKDYEHDNIRWATNAEQNKNKKKKVYFLAIDPNKNLHISDIQTDFAKKYNLNPTKINACLHNKRKQHKNWTFKLLDKKAYQSYMKKGYTD